MRPDGLYRVSSEGLTAGFVIEGGKVTLCAPILRRSLDHWMTVADAIERRTNRVGISSDDVAARGLSVTIKYDKGHDATWAVFRGLPAEVREDIIGYFGLDSASVSGLTLHELTVNATHVAHGVGAVATTLGGVAIGSSQAESAKIAARLTGGVPPKGGDPNDGEAQANPWARNGDEPPAEEEKPAANPNAHLYTAIENAADVDALKRIWAEDQAAFANDAELLATWKAKGKALKAAAK